MQLTESQIAFIDAILQQEVQYAPLHEELLDHLCCAVERKCSQGKPFHQAWQEVFANYTAEQIRATEAETLSILNHQNLFNVKKAITLTTILCVLAVSLIWANSPYPPEILPLQLDNPRLTSGFGMRMHPELKVKKLHKGVDYACALGTPVVATADGVVVEVKMRKGYGNTIIIQHDDEFKSLYAHLSTFKVAVGQQVKQGEMIALSGNTGKSSVPHLHYEVYKNGKNVDPAKYIAEAQ